MKLWHIIYACAVARRVSREEGVEGEPADIPDDDVAEGVLDSALSDEDSYDMSDYYEEYEGSGTWFDTFKGVGSKFMNIFGNDDVDDFEYEGSAIVEDWWNTFNNEDYDKSLYEDEEDAKYERVTAYPFPHLNEQGHANMADYRYRDTLDEYFDIFVIVLSGSILFLLACAGYSRVRNVKYLKEKYGNTQDEGESDGLLTSKN
ncbi:Oidioi.mRNA.OKI2018_I69.chr2.g4388.t1.cds [Oikopleura dioica]|uniref:Oidioi.mRNA.OKI2018_I69.chr2.g4388.t1.cds n=1 Tax=Oikopleura dioica TaxID=34765 RepID=A0ABN7T3T0_OIKDI|nr:Oidioi.mRNA.OKI2018_I69.chr2.g4388.t1.cds [Oikopleura dioica]